MTNAEIVSAIEAVCPLEGQESWDNSGWQAGDPSQECTGVLLCVDVTDEIISEAVELGCNLIVAHHPLIFKATRSIIDNSDRIGHCIARAFREGISVYSSHTACDCAPEGVSVEMAGMLGLRNIRPLDQSGLGAVGELPEPMGWQAVLSKVKATFGIPVLRHSAPPSPDHTVTTIALCGGSAAEFLPESYDKGAQMYVTADCKHNCFLDVGSRRTMLVDAGHFETEECTKEIFMRAISEKFPNFAVWKSAAERNPVKYF